MIIIEDKRQCCGCNACVQYCPKSCITMQEDEEGFLYPIINKTACIDCGLCEKVCPVLNQKEEREPLKVYAAKNKNDEIRMQSSLGGIFTLLAEQIIQEGGVVFGARFNDDWEVIHDYTDAVEGLAVFRGSKYVQSKIGNTFQLVEQFLKQGRKVLFSGTPCQVAGLKLFLRKEYENLLIVDFICHGVPSPGVWKKYLQELIANQDDKKKQFHSNLNIMRNISHIEFRNKCLGWKKYSFALSLSVPDIHGIKKTVLFSEPYTENIFMKGFLANLYLRPSCYSCPSNRLKSGSDITIGDYWGIQNIYPNIDDDKGICCVMVNTEKGIFSLSSVDMHKLISSYEEVCKGNPALIRSVSLPNKRREFYKQYHNIPLLELISKQTRLPILLRSKILVYDMLVKLNLLKSR